MNFNLIKEQKSYFQLGQLKIDDLVRCFHEIFDYSLLLQEKSPWTSCHWIWVWRIFLPFLTYTLPKYQSNSLDKIYLSLHISIAILNLDQNLVQSGFPLIWRKKKSSNWLNLLGFFVTLDKNPTWSIQFNDFFVKWRHTKDLHIIIFINKRCNLTKYLILLRQELLKQSMLIQDYFVQGQRVLVLNKRLVWQIVVQVWSQ